MNDIGDRVVGVVCLVLAMYVITQVILEKL